VTVLNITTNLDLNPWTELQDGVQAGRIPAGDWTDVGVLPAGMASGRASVAIVITLPDGSKVIGQTSLRNFRLASVAVLATPVAEMEDM
jgi:hypothetical protein